MKATNCPFADRYLQSWYGLGNAQSLLCNVATARCQLGETFYILDSNTESALQKPEKMAELPDRFLPPLPRLSMENVVFSCRIWYNLLGAIFPTRVLAWLVF